MNNTDKPRVKFYSDGVLHYQSGSCLSPSENEVFGLQWFMEWMDTTNYYAWCKL